MIDEVLIRYEYTDSRYLSSAVLGAGIFGSVNLPYHLNDVTGAIGGLLFKTEWFVGNLHYIIPSVISSLSLGYMASSYLGQATNQGQRHSIIAKGAGFVVGAAETLLVNKNITSKYYVTQFIAGASFSNFWAGNILSVFSSATGGRERILQAMKILSSVSGGVYAGLNLDNVQMSWAPSELDKKITSSLERIIEPSKLHKMADDYKTFLLLQGVLGTELMRGITKIDTQLSHYIELMESPEVATPHWATFKGLYIPFLYSIVPYGMNRIYSDFVSQYFITKIETVIFKTNYRNFLNGQLPFKFKNNKTLDVLSDHITQDLSTLIGGFAFVTGTSKTFAVGIYHIAYLYKIGATDLLLTSFTYNQITKYPSKYLAALKQSYEESLRKEDTITSDMHKYLRSVDGAKASVISGELDFFTSEYDAHRDSIRTIKVSQSMIGALSGVYSWLEGVAENLMNYWIIAKKLSIGAMPFEERKQIRTSIYAVSSLASIPGEMAMKTASIEFAISNVKTYLDAIEALDSLCPGHSYIQGPMSIHLKNITVEYENQTAFSAHYLELNYGIYILTGGPTAIRSLFLDRMFGLHYQDAECSGEFVFSTPSGIKPKLVMLPSQLQAIPHISLIKFIYAPHILPDNEQEVEAIKSEIITLAAILEFNVSSRLADPVSLSRDEYLKAKLISLKLSFKQHKDQPHVFLMDQPFSFLDAHSKILVRDFVLKHFEGIFMVIGHNASDVPDFYTHELHFANKSLSVIEFASPHTQTTKTPNENLQGICLENDEAACF